MEAYSYEKTLALIIITALVMASFVGCGGDKGESIDELLELGLKYLVEVEYEEAIVAFDKVIAIDDKKNEAYVGLGDANVGLKTYEEAVPNFETAIDIDDSYIDGYVGLADTYVFMGDNDKTIETLKAGLSATADEQIQTIIDAINAGTYEPSIIHLHLEGSGNVENTSENEGTENEETPRLIKSTHYDADGKFMNMKKTEDKTKLLYQYHQ